MSDTLGSVPCMSEMIEIVPPSARSVVRRGHARGRCVQAGERPSASGTAALGGATHAVPSAIRARLKCGLSKREL